MRVGLIARSDHTGLSIQTWNFFRNMNPVATLVVDLSKYGHPAPDMGVYPGAQLWRAELGINRDFAHTNQPDPQIDWLLDQVDVVFTCETPYNYYLFTEAKRRGIKTVLQPNYEFLEYLVDTGLPYPDVFALPSRWHSAEILSALAGSEVRYLPVPVDTELLPFTPRKELRTILHTVGTVAQPFRNGTPVLYRAMELLLDIPVRAVVHAQRDTIGQYPPPNVELRLDTLRYYNDFYQAEMDMMVLPRRWGGLCLPMQEALASGMPVLMPDCAPNDEVLPTSMLVPAFVGDQLVTRAPIDLYDMNPQDLADRIRFFYENPAAMEEASEWARIWREAHTWEALESLYSDVFST